MSRPSGHALDSEAALSHANIGQPTSVASPSPQMPAIKAETTAPSTPSSKKTTSRSNTSSDSAEKWSNDDRTVIVSYMLERVHLTRADYEALSGLLSSRKAPRSIKDQIYRKIKPELTRHFKGAKDNGSS